MKKIFKLFVLVMIIVLAFSLTAMGSSVKQSIEVVFNSINLQVNGQILNSNNILYNGTTYVPLRDVAEMLGKSVDWNAATRTANISDLTDTPEINYEKITFNNGDVYEGQTKDGELHGYGKYYWVVGDSYEGDWVDGYRTGSGVYIWPNGEKYVGEFLLDFMSGEGTYYYNDGAKYVGAWLMDEHHGKGTLTYPDGSKYAGEYKNGLEDGQGKYTDISGEYFDGVFEEGKFLNGTAKIIDNGELYLFEFKNGEIDYKGEGSSLFSPIITAPELIESKIIGEFNGFKVNSLFELQNGQTWQQTSLNYTYTYKYMPNVTITKSGVYHKMQIEGSNETVNVMRIR